MKYAGPVFIVVALLLSAAVYYKLKSEPKQGVVSSTRMVGEPVAPVAGGVPVTSAMADGVLRLQASLSHGYLAQGVQGMNLYSSIDITALELKGIERPEVNVALVIDRSGSMQGRAMVDAKQAAQGFVARLADGDSVTVVSFSDNVRVDFPSSVVTSDNRRAISHSIERIYADGGTNISGGFEASVRELRKASRERSINRVILLTDGNPNYGMTTTQQLAEMARQYQSEGIALTAIGFGLDYNEDLMAAMADAGGGNYYYARDRDAVAAAFSSEFQQLNSVVARQAMLRVALGEGVRVAEVVGYPFEQRGQTVEIPLAEFYSGQNKNILMQLHTAARENGTLPIVDVRLDYEDRAKAANVTQQVSLAAIVTDDVKLLETGLDKEVLTRVEQVQIAQSVQVAMTQYQEGRAEEAKKTLQAQAKRTILQRKRYDLPKDKFQEASAEIMHQVKIVDTIPASSPAARSAVKASKEKGRQVRMSRSADW